MSLKNNQLIAILAATAALSVGACKQDGKNLEDKIDKLNEKEGDENMRTFAAGKDLLDVTDAKISAIKRKEEHESNIKIINDELSTRSS